MRTSPIHRRAALLLVVLWLLPACEHMPSPAIARLLQAQRAAAELTVQVSTAADASNRAVMADTDEASTQFAREAEQALAAGQRGLDTLGDTLRGLEYTDELGLLAQFRTAFERYRSLEHEILGLAVENTNLKAQRLAFGAGHAAAESLRAALEEAVAAAPPPLTWQTRALSLTVLAAVRELEVLQSPHIAAAEDATMTELEQHMAAQESAARGALAELAAVHVSIQNASAALESFAVTQREIIRLSRRNSNVRSLALSLGQKRTLTAACEDSLQALRTRLEKREFRGTR